MYLPINLKRFDLEELEDYTAELIEAYRIPVYEADEIEERAQERFTFPLNDEDATSKIIYIVFSEYADWICKKYHLNREQIRYYINGMASSISYNGINLIEKAEVMKNSYA
jgi:hypothetical protein